MTVAAAPVARAATATAAGAAGSRAPVAERLAHYTGQGLTEGQANTKLIAEGYTLEDLAAHKKAAAKKSAPKKPSAKKTTTKAPAKTTAAPATAGAPETAKGGQDDTRDRHDEDAAGSARRPPSRSTSTSPAVSIGTPAGALLAIVCYPAALAFIKDGPDGLKAWLRAKFLNRTTDDPAPLAAGASYIGARSIYTAAAAGAGVSALERAGVPAAASSGALAGKVAGAITFARAQIGEPYAWGATGPDRWDCSGLTQKAYASVGVKLPRTTYQQVLVGKAVSRADLQPGDLVFANPGHVAIYTGGGRIVEAPRAGKPVREVELWGFWRARRVVGAGQ